MNRYLTHVIYASYGEDGYFYSPDGVGRIFFDTRIEAKDEVGNLPVLPATRAQMEDSWSDN